MKKKKIDDVTMSVRIPKYLHKDLKRESYETYKSMNLLVIEALQDYLTTK